MTDRGLPSADGSPACPFVALEDDRDARADRPDHRHRCFAEAQPAPRALAHQEAYCLSSAFPVCPTFQDWARREAARSRGEAPPTRSAWAGPGDVAAPGGAAAGAEIGAAAAASGAAAAASDGPTGDTGSHEVTPDPDLGIAAGALASGARDEPDLDDADRGDEALEPGGGADEAVHRNPPRDWAAPPP